MKGHLVGALDGGVFCFRVGEKGGQFDEARAGLLQGQEDGGDVLE